MSFSLTRKTDYALVALSRLAEEAAGSKEPLSAREIAERYDLPLPLLMNVLKDLHRAEIVCSRRGAGGGYHLCKEPREISLLQIIEAIEGPVKMALCCEDEQQVHEEGQAPCVACRVLARCPIVTPMQRFGDMVRGFLERISLRDITTDESYVQLTRTLAKVPVASAAASNKPACSHA